MVVHGAPREKVTLYTGILCDSNSLRVKHKVMPELSADPGRKRGAQPIILSFTPETKLDAH